MLFFIAANPGVPGPTDTTVDSVVISRTAVRAEFDEEVQLTMRALNAAGEHIPGKTFTVTKTNDAGNVASHAIAGQKLTVTAAAICGPHFVAHCDGKDSAETVVGFGAAVCPYRRDVLGFEFYPDRDDAVSESSSGHAFTRQGTPTLISQRTGYSLDTADGLIFDDGDAINALLNENPAGFTVLVVAPDPGSDVGAGKQILNLYDNLVDFNAPLGIYAETGTTATRTFVSGNIAYNVDDYEGASKFATDNFEMPTGSKVYGLRFDRHRAIQAEVIHGDVRYAAERGRLSYFRDGIDTAGNGYAPDPLSVDPDVVAGHILEVVGGALYYGDSDGSGAFPRLGTVLLFTDCLTDAEILQIVTWINANHSCPASA